ncbi:MAG TPA: dephospho-CoA kinase [Candidatus Saccharimonadales bacterium]|nr:dephospho-CoA kinase [Candidatus Saccharimonadales bacterium]
MLKLGLTGGIASGKSTVAAMLLGMGFAVLDADSLAHKIVEPGQAAYDEVVKAFGPDVTTGGGRIDRARLGALVFADPEKLKRLNAIVHPRVHETMIRQLQDWEHTGTHDAVFVEAALLVEANFVKDLDGLVVVWCRPEQQLERLLARGLSEEEARQRIAAQLAVADKLQQATHTIDCSGTVEQTRRQVEALVDNIRQAAGKRKP